MIEKYKLKADARKFFDEKHHANINELKTWNAMGIPIQVLDEVESVYIDYGQENTYKSSSLRGWSAEGKIAKFRFTIIVNDIDMVDYEKTNMPELMDELQKIANKFFKYL